MNCRFKNKQIDRKIDYHKGVNDGVNTCLIMFAYVLSRYGYKGKKIQQMMRSVEDIADSINRGYVTHQDIEKVLWDEYGLIMKKRKEWVQESIKDT